MTSFVLKCIAVFSMFIDHISIASFKYTTLFNVLGRFAFPIFAFQITEGYTHTKDLKQYLYRLFVFAIISQIPFMLFESLFSNSLCINIFGTLFFGLLAIFLYDKISSKLNINSIIKKVIALTPAFLLGVLSQLCNFDYGFWGIAIIVLFYIFKDNKINMAIFFVIACIIKYAIITITHGYHYMYILLCLGTALSIVFICLYNGKQGKKIKYLLYIFYPVHLLILYFIFRA